MSQAGSDTRERDLLPQSKVEVRFTVKSRTGMAGTALWGVYDEVLQIEVFHWYGPTGEAKSNAVAKALNELGHEMD